MPRLPPVTTTVQGRLHSSSLPAPFSAEGSSLAFLSSSGQPRARPSTKRSAGTGRARISAGGWKLLRKVAAEAFVALLLIPQRQARCRARRRPAPRRASAAAAPLDGQQVEVQRRGGDRIAGDEAEVRHPGPGQREGDQPRQRARRHPASGRTGIPLRCQPACVWRVKSLDSSDHSAIRPRRPSPSPARRCQRAREDVGSLCAARSRRRAQRQARHRPAQRGRAAAQPRGPNGQRHFGASESPGGAGRSRVRPASSSTAWPSSADSRSPARSSRARQLHAVGGVRGLQHQAFGVDVDHAVVRRDVRRQRARCVERAADAQRRPARAASGAPARRGRAARRW